MRRRLRGLPVLLALALLAPVLLPATARSAPADEDEARDAPAPWLDVSGAQVFAARDLPHGLWPHLPEGRAPAPWAWPLPADGPVVLLGLPLEDPHAADLGAALGIYALGEDLGGGYRIAAWEDAGRPIVLVLAADAVALLAARFEFVASASAEQLDPMMRSVDVRRPDAQASTLVRRGVRDERPQRAWRAWRCDPALFSGAGGTTRETGALHARLGAHRIGRIVVPLDVLKQAAARLAGSGVGLVPVVVPTPGTLDALRARLAAASTRPSTGELLVDATAFGERPLPALRALDLRFVDHLLVTAPTAAAALAIATWQRAEPGGLSLLVPARAGGDAWAAVTAAALRQGHGVVLDETWVAPTLGAASPRLVPTPAPAIDAWLAEAAGILVTGDLDDAGPLLEGAWTGAPPRDDQADVLAALPAGTRLAADPRAEVVRRLTPLATPLRPRVRALLAALGAEAAWTVVPIVPAGAVIDGQLGEPAWGRAVRLPHVEDAYVVSDGRVLLLGVRGTAARRHATVALGADGTRVEIDVAAGSIQVQGPRRERLRTAGVQSAALRSALRQDADGTWTAEVALDRVDLGVDAHAGQVIGPFPLADGGAAALLIAR